MQYNLYYKNRLINTKGTVDESAIEELKKREYIFKVTQDANKRIHRERIPTKDITVIKTFVF